MVCSDILILMNLYSACMADSLTHVYVCLCVSIYIYIGMAVSFLEVSLSHKHPLQIHLLN